MDEDLGLRDAITPSAFSAHVRSAQKPTESFEWQKREQRCCRNVPHLPPLPFPDSFASLKVRFKPDESTALSEMWCCRSAPGSSQQLGGQK